MSLEPGMRYVRKYVTTQQHSAKHVGSGSVEVLSTPSMILFMEETCRVFSDEHLPEGQTTVGIHVDVYHVRPAPIGSEVEIRSTLLQFDGKKLVFWVEAWCSGTLIGYGLHERAVVDKEKFLLRVKG